MAAFDELHGDLPVHLVGSVPLDDSDDVFRTVAGALGDRIACLTDGETGPRLMWNAWTFPAIARTPGLRAVDRTADDPRPWPALVPSGDAADLVIGPLGFADAAIESYGAFARLKADGRVAPDLRFQVDLPTAVAAMIAFVRKDCRATVEPAHNAALAAEISQIVDVVPHDQLAFQ